MNSKNTRTNKNVSIIFAFILKTLPILQSTTLTEINQNIVNTPRYTNLFDHKSQSLRCNLKL